MDLSVSGINLFYTDNARPAVPTVVFIHGFPFDHSMWAAQKALLEPSFRVITFDLRGHGQSELGETPFLFETYVDDFLGLLDALHIDKAIFCGLSMGGYIVLRTAERAPDRVQGLILCGTRSEADSNEAKGKRAASIRVIREQGVPPFVEGFLPLLFAPSSFKEKAPIVERVRQVMLENTKDELSTSLVAMATRTDTTASLSAIQVPTLILVGEKDPITTPASAAAMHALIPASQLELIPNAGHLSPIENPPFFNSHLLAFMKRFHSVE